MGTAYKYLVFPDEGHGFRKKENEIATAEKVVAFLDRYLGSKRPAPAAAR